MRIGLVLVGDEILSGRRVDKHLPQVAAMLQSRGLCLSWVRVLGDDPSDLEVCYRETLASADLVLSAGGIGATPDDLTRQAVAAALGERVERHPEGVKLLQKFAAETGRELTPERYRLVEFPSSAKLIPNPYNGIPGFYVKHHYFVPGFPQMAWPMLEWVMDTHYADLHNKYYSEISLMLYSANESSIIPLMEDVLNRFPRIKLFSLPILGDPPRIELGVKGPVSEAKTALQEIKQQLGQLGIEWDRAN